MMTTFEALTAARKVAALMAFDDDPAGPRPVTKLGGAPFWPAGVDRPRCDTGHDLSFLVQVRLSDVPGMGEDDALLSLHYCIACMDEGDMSFGHDDDSNPTGYRADLFLRPDQLKADGLGALGQTIPERTPQFEAAEEIMSLDDYWEQTDQSFEYPNDAEELAELGFPAWHHREAPKLGGWPSWVQSADWLACPHDRPYVFVGQVNDEILPEGAWASGGFGYMWACSADCPDRHAEMSAQST